MRHFFTALAIIVAVLSPTSAYAYEEQLTLGVDLGYGGVLANDALPAHGLSFGFGGSWGLNDAWTVRGHLGWSYHPGDPVLHVGILGAEVLYVVDILTWVPFVGLGLDGIGTVVDGSFGMDLGAHAVVGLDYVINRDWIVGTDIRAYVLPFELAENGVDPVYLTATLRVSKVFALY